MSQFKPCIKFPKPGIRAHADVPWKVADLCKAYNFPTGLKPGGVIGILELGGSWDQGDLDFFSALNNLPQIIVEDFEVDGGSKSVYGSDPDSDGEVALDIEVCAAAYYYATGEMPAIKMFWAPNDSASFVSVIQAAVAQGCNVLSISWGGAEASFTEEEALTIEAAAATASEAGMVIFAASGDNSEDDDAPWANVDIPSACKHVVSCGGTTKTATSETGWGDGSPNGTGSGGGFSHYFSRPDWQHNAPLMQHGRMTPDISANSDPNTGYLVVVGGQEQPIGGTSAVAPLYAGLFAAISGGSKLGFITKKLWKHQQCFNDITQGSNGWHCQIGPDPVTGLGSPRGQALADLFSETVV